MIDQNPRDPLTPEERRHVTRTAYEYILINRRELSGYVHPESLDLTWNGKGRQPGWVADWIASGRDIDECLVLNPATLANPWHPDAAAAHEQRRNRNSAHERES
ncbi:H-NS family nucleoid-associated regulatory protein [Streptomyces sp. NPDC057854]|uniref:H-NS family nucleoid-associated regulatory protein n=1 Tax=unclassified Streptomyces TaxID=2593676 RepID=UPI0036CA20BA